MTLTFKFDPTSVKRFQHAKYLGQISKSFSSEVYTGRTHSA